MAGLFDGEPVTAQDMLGCARRELQMRKTVYPRWVAKRKLSQEKADQELRFMGAIVEHFEGLVSRGA